MARQLRQVSRWSRGIGNGLLCLLLLQAGNSTAGKESPTPVPILPSSLQWRSPPGIDGLEFAWMLGSGSDAGAYALRVRLREGALIPPHTHPDPRHTTVLSGTLYVGFSTEFDVDNAVRVPAGAVYLAPAGVAHFVWAGNGDVVYQESGTGPTANVFLPR